MKYCIRKPQMTAGAYRKANRVARSRHAIDKQAEELVFEAACGLDSAIDSPLQRRCACLQTGGLPLLFPGLSMPVADAVVLTREGISSSKRRYCR